MMRLEELMDSLTRDDGAERWESEHFLSRKASMDQFSNPGDGERAKRGESYYPPDGIDEDLGAGQAPKGILRNVSRASFEFIPSPRVKPTPK